jgi:hypothetical protein
MSQTTLATTVGDDKKTITDRTRKYYGQLIGATVSHVVLAKDIEEDWTHDEYRPILALVKPDGGFLYVEVQRDPEGNGAGHLHISTIEEDTNNG